VSTAPPTSPTPQPSSAAVPQHSTAKYVIFGVVMTAFLIADQASKIWVQRNLRLYKDEVHIIDGFLSFIHAENPGAAFGIGAGTDGAMYVFAVFTVVAVVVLGQMLWQLPSNERFQTVALGLISSGAVGNAIDRVDKRTVTDFVRVYTEAEPYASWLRASPLGQAEWPTWNVADAGIVVGLGMFAFHYFFLQRDSDAETPDPARPLQEEGAKGGSGV
jgi:signal peptidase II